MAVADRSIDPRILESAKREFLEKGYENASLKAICAGAGITTGALYKRYKGKEDLFGALVEPAVKDLNDVLAKKNSIEVAALSDAELMQAWDMDEDYMLWWFAFLEARRDGFILLLRYAEGTAWSNFKHDWVEKMTNATGIWLHEAQRRGLADADIDDKELHALLSAFWTTIYEPFIHDFSRDMLRAYCKRVCRLFNWYGAMGFPGHNLSSR